MALASSWLNPLSLVAVAGFLASIARGEQSFVYADAAVCALSAATLFLMPSVPLWVFTNVQNVDPYSKQLNRALGAVQAAHAAFAFFSAHLSIDLTDREASVRSRLFSNASLLLALLYAQVHYSEWTLRHVQFVLLGVLLWTLPLLYFFFSFTTAGGVSLADYDIFLHLDFLGTLGFGLAAYAFPQWVYVLYMSTERPNGVNIHLIRCLGALFLGSAVLSYCMLYSATHMSKKALLLSHFVGGLLLLVSILISHIESDMSSSFFVAGTLGSCVWSGNALVGFFATRFQERMAKDGLSDGSFPHDIPSSADLSAPRLHLGTRWFQQQQRPRHPQQNQVQASSTVDHDAVDLDDDDESGVAGEGVQPYFESGYGADTAISRVHSRVGLFAPRLGTTAPSRRANVQRGQPANPLDFAVDVTGGHGGERDTR
ncbi:hypothetical protein FVE85_1258 [Porphyridium purpureum]|uniref:Transmembrane protein n=1 Tax=Porphyridium purpureum TaxID=35688 RepID=A0A5J4YH81_PORPP|nr:hypothetical protein FVE85_1258 [Porphyridium purpureum]|eukprot:POR9831..scf251_18